jgi:hypothetical protein
MELQKLERKNTLEKIKHSGKTEERESLPQQTLCYQIQDAQTDSEDTNIIFTFIETSLNNITLQGL